MTRTIKPFFFVLLLPIFCLTGCKFGKASEKDTFSLAGDTLTARTQYLTLVRIADGVTVAEIRNPWQKDTFLNRFILVDENADESDVPRADGYRTIKVPVKSALVYAGVHTAPIVELGKAGLIAGVADAAYITVPEVKELISEGKITDVGNSMSPSLEKIVAMSPDVALISPYQNSGHGVLDKTNITVVDMADYMEPTPLARAEWIKLVGLLTGTYSRAVAVYDEVEAQYNAIARQSVSGADRPLVLCEVPFSGVWYQPGRESYMAALIGDAGARTLDVGRHTDGSVQLDVSTVLDKGSQADFWLIKSTGPVTLDGLKKSFPLATAVKAFNDRKVFFSNTNIVPLYDDLAFHPERVLSDLHAIFSGKGDLRYFRAVGN